MTRVLFVTESFHPTLGGGETHIRRLAAALVAAGDDATVVTRRADPAWAAEETLDGVRVLRVGAPGPARSGKYRMLPAASRAVWRELARHDVLVVRGTRVLGVPGLLAGRMLGKPVVLQPEINGELSGEAFTWGKPWAGGILGAAVRDAVEARNWFFRDASAFVAMSRQIEDEMLAAGVPHERIHRLAHGVDVERFRPADEAERRALRASLGLPLEAILVTYAGRLLRGKGLEALVDAMASPVLPESLHLLLLGSGEGQLDVEPELRRRVSEGGLAGRVRFAGRVDVAGYLRASDLFVFPSLFEALGIALVEAAACGLPAVASRTGGIVDVVEDGRSGLLVPPGSVEALADALATLARDPAQRAAMGREARSVAVARFDERDVLERYRALFNEISSRRS